MFINACDIATTPDKAPTEAVSNLDLTIYRGEADRRQALFMQGQDTLVISGSTAETEEGTPVAVGSGEVIELPITGKAEFIGPSSNGLPEMRQALEGDRDRAEMLTDALGNAQDASRASGEALSIRVSARTATLTQVAKTGAFGLQTSLRILAEWLGANPDQVIVEPNLDFAAKAVEGRQLVDFMTARAMGMPLSLEQLHRWSAERGVTELTFEEELEQIAAEAEAADALAGAETTNPDGPTDDEGEAPPDDEDQAA